MGSHWGIGGLIILTNETLTIHALLVPTNINKMPEKIHLIDILNGCSLFLHPLAQWFPTFFCSRAILLLEGMGGHEVEFFYIQLH